MADDSLLGFPNFGSSDATYGGLLNPDQRRQVAIQQMIGTLGAIGAAGQPSRLPVPLGAAFGHGALAGQEAGNRAALQMGQMSLLAPEIQLKHLQAAQLGQRLQTIQDALNGTGPFAPPSQTQAAQASLSGGGGPTNANAAAMNGMVAGNQAMPGQSPTLGGLPPNLARGATVADFLGPTAGKAFETLLANDPSVVGPRAAAEARAAAPYKAFESLLGRAGQVHNIGPGEIGVTGFATLPPVIQGALDKLLQGAGLGGGSGLPAALRGGGSVAPSVPPQANAGGTGEGAPTTSATGFPTQSMHGPGGSIQNPISLEGRSLQTEVLPKQYEKAGENYASAQTMGGQLNLIDNAIEDLNKSGWSSTGSGAGLKFGAIKTINSVASSLGMGTPFNPEKIGKWEDFNKESTRMGFELAKTLGSREAQMIVQQAISAVPNAENTYMGARLVSSSLRQASQRQMDYYEFLTDFAKTHGGNTIGADIAFNKLHPVKSYTDSAIANAVPPAAVARLRQNPDEAPLFDKTFGADMSKRFLGAP